MTNPLKPYKASTEGPTMIQVKHFMDPPENVDGIRIWVEPFNLVHELRELCKVEFCSAQMAPPMQLRRWFEVHPYEYEEFRGRYHEHLVNGPYAQHLHRFAIAATGPENVTLLHDEDDPDHNAATALAEFLSELTAWKLK